MVNKARRIARLKEGETFTFCVDNEPKIDRLEKGDKIIARRQDAAEDGQIVLVGIYNSKSRIIQKLGKCVFILARITHTDNGYILAGDTPGSGSLTVDHDTAPYFRIFGKAERFFRDIP